MGAANKRSRIYDACNDVNHQITRTPFTKHQNFNKSQRCEATSHELHSQNESSIINYSKAYAK